MILFLLKGISIGFTMMLAIGPISMLCIAKTIEKGRLTGLAIGLGAATADGIYSFIAVFGLTFITSFLTKYILFIQLIGGAFLIYLGIKMFFSKPSTKKIILAETDFLKSYFSTLFLTLTSPMTILLFMTIFAGLGIISTSNSDYLSSGSLVLGVFLGSVLFYLMLITLTNFFRTKMTPKHLHFGSKISGIIICTFGIISVANLF
ncbi:LysE family translocator [Patescibacteria group bacterium]|nr:LysE family translocator [Patescibacteria group bacterium]